MELIKKASLTAVDAVQINDLAAGIPWSSPVHLQSITSALTAGIGASTKPVAKKRRVQQDFKNFLSYCTEPFWKVFAGPTTAPETRLGELCHFLALLGLRCPTEPTLKLMCSAWVCATHTKQSLASFDLATKSAMFKHVKLTFDTARKRHDDPVEYVACLPSDPTLFLRDHPALWAACFGPLVPQPPPPSLDVMTIRSFDMSYGCRGSMQCPSFANAGAASTSNLACIRPPLVQQPFDRPSDNAMERVASEFMSKMIEMQSGQHKLLEYVLASQRGAGSLQALSMEQHLLRKPTLALSSAAPATPASGPSIEELPAEPTSGALAHVVPALADRSPSSAEFLRESPRVADSSPVEEMLDAFEARRKSKAKAAVAPPSAPEVPEMPTPPLVAGPAAKTKAKAKAAKAAAPPLARPSKLPSAKKVQVAAVPKVKQVSSKPKPTITKPKPLTVGCSKCRWSSRGCSRCRAADFSGTRWNPAE